MSKDYKLFAGPKKSGRTQIRDKYNNLICNASTEWERDEIFQCIAEINEVERLRAENARLMEIATEKATRMDELHEALDKLVETSECNENQLADELLEKYEPSSKLIEAKKVLNKNKLGGDV